HKPRSDARTPGLLHQEVRAFARSAGDQLWSAAFSCFFSDRRRMVFASMSSRVRPRVSGTRRVTNRTPRTQMTAKIANTASWLMVAVMIGNSRPTRNDPIQLNELASPEARPRIASGKISPTITQVRGAQVKE